LVTKYKIVRILIHSAYLR